MDRVSVTLTTRDRPGFVFLCLSSLLSQTFKDWDLVIVDAYVRFLGSAAAGLGCRMHAAIVALIQGVPAHCFYATSRIKSWGDDFFTGQWVLPISELTASRLCALTDMLLSGSTERFEPFTQRVELLRARTEHWLEANLARR